MKITKPGIYRDFDGPSYFRDPCPEPSLSQSIGKLLIERSPLHAWTDSPRLNPNYEHDDDTKFDIGNVAHKLILGRGKDFEVVQFADWRTKDARLFREQAAEQGLIAVLEHQFVQASDMVEAAWMQLRKHEDHDAFTQGAGEVVIAWEEDGIWFRSLIDWLHDDLCTIDDYKTTGMSVAPHVLGLRAEAGGWHIQAAFIERGLDVLDPNGAGRRKYRWVAQENSKPHALNVMHMDEHWLTMGRKHVDAAVSRWKHAISSGKWQGYPHRGIVPEYPGYAESKFLDRELSGEFEPDPKLIMAG